MDLTWASVFSRYSIIADKIKKILTINSIIVARENNQSGAVIKFVTSRENQDNSVYPEILGGTLSRLQTIVPKVITERKPEEMRWNR